MNNNSLLVHTLAVDILTYTFLIMNLPGYKFLPRVKC